MVAMVPEGLPATLTLSLAMGVQRMARRQALLKRLSSVETLGSTTVICTDKTGTLTVGAMTVQEVFAGGERWHVTGAGYGPDGTWVPDEATRATAPPALLLRCAVLCNRSRLIPPDSHGEWRIVCDPTEEALTVAARKAGVSQDDALAVEPRVAEIPFDSGRKRMTTMHAHAVGVRVYIKGAPQEVLPRCTRWATPGGERVLTEEMRGSIGAENDRHAGAALRVLACAYRDVPATMVGGSPDDVERDLTFLGLMAMLDAPRPEVAQAVEAAQRAGIRLLIITGDYGLTAEAIARHVGLVRGTHARIVTGWDLDAMDDAGLLAAIDHEDVIFARIAPEHKLRIVDCRMLMWSVRSVLTALVFTQVSCIAPAREVSILIGTAMGARFLAEGDVRRRLVAATAMLLGLCALIMG